MTRYARQQLFPGVGEEGQHRLQAGRVAVAGCGATGSAIAALLARAGVGFLRVIDRDFVEWNNLQRQLLYDEQDARDTVPKAVAARGHLERVNSDIQVEDQVAHLSPENVDRLLGDVDLVMDGTDNLETRYLINDACVRDGRPWIYCGAVASYGMELAIRPGESACFRCLFPHPPATPGATCDTAGVLGPVITAVASLAAMDALKLLTGRVAALPGALTQVDLWDNTHVEVHAKRRLAREGDPGCPCCVRREFPFLAPATASHVVALCGRDAVQVSPARPAVLDLAELAARLAPLGEARATAHLLRATLDGLQLTLFPDGRAIVHGTDDETTARSFYSRYVGL